MYVFENWSFSAIKGAMAEQSARSAAVVSPADEVLGDAEGGAGATGAGVGKARLITPTTRAAVASRIAPMTPAVSNPLRRRDAGGAYRQS
jgi:hypothetical protein